MKPLEIGSKLLFRSTFHSVITTIQNWDVL